MDREAAERFVKALINSALFVDSVYRPGDWKREADLTPEERERGEAGRRWRDQPRPGDRKPR